MIKKMLLILLLFFSFSSLSFAVSDTTSPTSISADGIASKNFTIDTSLFSPGGTKIEKGKGAKTGQNLLVTIIEKLILLIGVIALFIMTIGSGYMIMHHGDDSLLKKGKDIFKRGLVAIVLALSAEIIVKFVAYLLY